MGDSCCIYHNTGGDPGMACGGDRARKINPRRDPAAGEAPSQAQMRMAATAQARERANRERVSMTIYRVGGAWFVRSTAEGRPPGAPEAVIVDVYAPDPRESLGAKLSAIHGEALPPVPAEQIAEGRDEAAGSNPAGIYGQPAQPVPVDGGVIADGYGRIVGTWRAEVDPLDDVRACAREALVVIGRARIAAGSMAQGDREELTRALDAFDLARNRSRAGLTPKDGPDEVR